MKTDELISLLASDRLVAAPPGRTLVRDWSCGAVLALLAVVLTLGMRQDIGQALTTLRFALKPLFTLSLAATAAGLLWRLARPAAPLRGWPRALLLAPALLAVAVGVELYVVPSRQWAERAVGHNALWCLLLIPLLSLLPLACGILSLRKAAPTRPLLSGAVAGLLAGALAATAYALHCTDDSPLFVALWYSLALGVACALGALAGSRLLRW